MLNWDRIRELRDEIGEEDYAEVIELFFEEVDATISRLTRPGSMCEREADLHFLRGSALNIGFSVLGELCEKGELRAIEGTLDESDIATVINTYAASRDAFDEARAHAA
jgi:histidine phosphotransfer protein HptB